MDRRISFICLFALYLPPSEPSQCFKNATSYQETTKGASAALLWYISGLGTSNGEFWRVNRKMSKKITHEFGWDGTSMEKDIMVSGGGKFMQLFRTVPSTNISEIAAICPEFSFYPFSHLNTNPFALTRLHECLHNLSFIQS